jgi:predicted GNAT family acetyltransferase
MKVIITHNEIQAWENDEQLGKIVFEVSNDKLLILHTYAYQSGRGIGTRLMQEATTWAKEQGYTIVPICTFAKKYLKM